MTADPYREWDAAYVLGALAPDERRLYEQHLTDCSACRAAVGELAGMPALLSKVPHGASGAETGASVVPIEVLADAARRRRTRHRTLRAVAAVALVAVGGFGGVAVTGRGDTPPPVIASGDPGTSSPPVAPGVSEVRTVSLTAVGQSGVTADLTLVSRGWGTRLDWTCEYAAAALAKGVYELVLVETDGGRSVVATWTSTGAATAAGLGASSAVPVEGIQRIELSAVGADIPLAAADVATEA